MRLPGSLSRGPDEVAPRELSPAPGSPPRARRSSTEFAVVEVLLPRHLLTAIGFGNCPGWGGGSLMTAVVFCVSALLRTSGSDTRPRLFSLSSWFRFTGQNRPVYLPARV